MLLIMAFIHTFLIISQSVIRQFLFSCIVAILISLFKGIEFFSFFLYLRYLLASNSDKSTEIFSIVFQFFLLYSVSCISRLNFFFVVLLELINEEFDDQSANY